MDCPVPLQSNTDHNVFGTVDLPIAQVQFLFNAIFNFSVFEDPFGSCLKLRLIFILLGFEMAKLFACPFQSVQKGFSLCCSISRTLDYQPSFLPLML
jgi:hypothetical protein